MCVFHNVKGTMCKCSHNGRDISSLNGPATVKSKAKVDSAVRAQSLD